MKKIVYSAAIVCILALAVSCKSTKTEKKASENNYKKQEVSEIAEEQATSYFNQLVTARAGRVFRR